jgi:hypothetical protein
VARLRGARDRGTLTQRSFKSRTFKAGLLVLLAANTVYFAVVGTASKGIDAFAWLTLLLLFDIETAYKDRLRSRGAQLGVRAARLLAGAGVIAATIGYVFEEDTLDAVNAVLWIAVVVLLEMELRWPALIARQRTGFNIAAVALFGGLALLVLLWAASGMWLDAYDAVLWLVAFAAIEVDLTRRPGDSPQRAAT